MASGHASLGAVDVAGAVRGREARVRQTDFLERASRDADRRQLRDDDAGLAQYGATRKEAGDFPLAVDAAVTAARSLPESALGDVSAAMQRQLPDADELRRPLSGKAQDLRSKVKNATIAKLPQTRKMALAEVVASPQPTTLNRVNSALYDVAGDVQQLDEDDRTLCRRVDEAIRSYERRGAEAGATRDHVVYAEAALPGEVGPRSVLSYSRAAFEVGADVYVDNYMPTQHSLDAVSGAADDRARPVFEILTRRGMYLGTSRRSRIASTGHLLPRGMQYSVVGVHEADYVDAQGVTGTRVVVQLVDVDR